MARLENIRIDEGCTSCTIVDQTRLPRELVHRTLSTPEEFYEAIATLAVRGAPCIGKTAAFAMACFAQQAALEGCSFEDARERLYAQADYLQASRPTAVNLAYELDRAREICGKTAQDAWQLAQRLRDHACDLEKNEKRIYESIARFGLDLLEPGATILTHCNAGPLGCGWPGTALGPAILGAAEGKHIKVYADETRPLLQGARLTTFELSQAGVDVTLICDNMAATVMAQGKIDAVMVGADRIAANGDTANKIGTYGVAVLANHFGIPFYVLAPKSTIDIACTTGADIPIEERSGDEIKTMWYEQPMAPEEVQCYNPAFDVTDAKIISAIITEDGVAYPPFEESLREVMSS
ncbi:MAG: S-methyl-5-thioribose-1-phosphate isomerase [Eggerthellaceae bacterium]|nr:S-methyl-5-thioribose-1-phosphate isomerase [Eggerthellaceae bacterium]